MSASGHRRQRSTNLLGWNVIEKRTSSGPDDRLSFIAGGRGVAFGVSVGSGKPIDDTSHVAFALSFDECPALEQSLRDPGVPLEEPFIDEAGDRISFFDDPAGNRAQITGLLMPLPSRNG